MSQVETALDSNVVAVYPNHSSAEEAVRRLVKEGIAMKDVSIVGRDFQVQEEPIGFVRGVQVWNGVDSAPPGLRSRSSGREPGGSTRAIAPR